MRPGVHRSLLALAGSLVAVFVWSAIGPRRLRRSSAETAQAAVAGQLTVPARGAIFTCGRHGLSSWNVGCDMPSADAYGGPAR